MKWLPMRSKEACIGKFLLKSFFGGRLNVLANDFVRVNGSINFGKTIDSSKVYLSEYDQLFKSRGKSTES